MAGCGERRCQLSTVAWETIGQQSAHTILLQVRGWWIHARRHARVCERDGGGASNCLKRTCEVAGPVYDGRPCPESE